MPSRAPSLESTKQAVKTAIAGVAALALTKFFNLPEGYWAAISALIVMQSNVGATVDASRTRLAGTAVGAVIGGLAVAVWGSHMLGFALAVAIAFLLCDFLRLAESQRLATVTIAIIMLAGHTTSAWVVALHRFTEVALGIMVALAVSLTLWPNHARRTVREGVAQTLGLLRDFYAAVMAVYRGGDPAPADALRAQLATSVRKNGDLLKNALQESFGPMKERESLSLLVQQVERIYHALETLEFALRDGNLDAYFRNFEPAIGRLETGVATALDSLSKKTAGAEPEGQWPDLPASITTIDDQAAVARKAGATQKYPLDEVLRFYFLLLSSRNLVLELEVAHSLP
jgi:uncharacterized membrane protein YccC